MSANKSRLGKGLGALFPALPGEDALVEPMPNIQENVSHETNQQEVEAKVSRETLKNDSFNSKSVSHETRVPSMSKSIAPHEDKENNKTKDVSRETVPSIQNNKHGRKRSTCLLYTSPSPRDRTRSRMPSSA